jgi:hypothetical protein
MFLSIVAFNAVFTVVATVNESYSRRIYYGIE